MTDIAPGLRYFHRASHPLPENGKSWNERNPTVRSTGAFIEPTGASRILTFLPRFCRVNGEVRVSSTNVANSPYHLSVFAAHPELERVSASIVLGDDIADLVEGRK